MQSSFTTGQLAQLEPQVERLQQQCEALRAELQSSKHDSTSLSQQVADMEAAAAMHLAHQVRPASWSVSTTHTCMLPDSVLLLTTIIIKHYWVCQPMLVTY